MKRLPPAPLEWFPVHKEAELERCGRCGIVLESEYMEDHVDWHTRLSARLGILI